MSQGGRRGFRSEDSGAVLVFLVILLPLLLLIGGIATDISMMNAQKRYAQGQADMAAQSASRFLPDPVAVRAEVRRVVSANAQYGVLELAESDIEMGSWAGRGSFTPLAEQAVPAGATAVRVTVPSPLKPFQWAPILREGDLVIRKQAIGRNQAMVVFTLRNRLLGLDTRKSILDAVLASLGVYLGLRVLSYDGLAGTKINLNDLLRLATANVSLEALSFDDVLNLPIGIDKLLGGLVSLKALPVGTVLPVPLALGKIRLRDILATSPGFLTARAGDVLPDISLSALDLVTAFVGLASRPEQRIGVTTGLNLAPLASVSLDLGLIRPPVTVIARPDEVPPVVAHLDQTNLNLEADVLGILNLGAVVEVAEAQAKVISVTCSGPTAAAVFDVSTFPAGIDIRLALGAGLTNRTPRDMKRIPILGKTQRVAVPLSSIGKAVPIANPISLSGAVTDLNSVLKKLKADAEDEKSQLCKGLITCTQGLLGSVLGALLSTLTTILDGLNSLIGAVDRQGELLNALLRLLGMDAAQAEIILNSATCGGGLIE